MGTVGMLSTSLRMWPPLLRVCPAFLLNWMSLSSGRRGPTRAIGTSVSDVQWCSELSSGWSHTTSTTTHWGVTIDTTALDQLPQDGNISQLVSVAEDTTTDSPSTSDTAAAEDDSCEEDLPQSFVPVAAPSMTEQETVQQSVQQRQSSHSTLMWPTIGGMPLNEFTTEGYFTCAFPTLFPTGAGDFLSQRQVPVTIGNYFKHLMQYDDGRFARHPRFRFFALNTEMRHRALQTGRVYVRQHPGDGQLSSYGTWWGDRERPSPVESSTSPPVSVAPSSTSLYKTLKLLVYKVCNHIMPASLAVQKHFHQRKKILLIATNVIHFNQYTDAKPKFQHVWSFSMEKITTHYRHLMMYLLLLLDHPLLMLSHCYPKHLL